ncbi:MAG: ATP-binding cassette domain-containing protein, partial [Candidatus Limnocylindrales bacterium]
AGQLSGGQQAQLALAIAMGMRARVILLDEPLASLDPLARVRFLSFFLDATRALDATAVVSSHLVSDIADVCDQILLVSRGRTRLCESIASARARHGVRMDAEAGPANLSKVEAYEGGRLPPGVRPATLDEIVIEYLRRDEGARADD